MEGYVPMHTVSVTKAEQDEDNEQETALEFAGMVGGDGEIPSWRDTPVLTGSMLPAEQDRDGEETAVEFGGMVAGNGGITLWRADGTGREDGRREGQEATEDDGVSCSNLEFGPPRTIEGNIHEHVQWRQNLTIV